MPSTRDIFRKIHQSLSADPSRMSGLTAVYQFNLTGEDPGVYQIILKEHSAAAVEGTPEVPQCTLELTASDFKDMLQGRLNGTLALMSGKLRVKGDVSLAMRLKSVLKAYSA